MNDYLDDIVKNINKNLKDIDKTERFDTKNNGHVALLIYELTLIFKALKLKEINKFLEILSISVNINVIKRLLFLLEKLSLVTKKRLGNVDYYLPLKTEHRISFSSIDTKQLFVRSSTVIGSALYYATSEKEKMRMRVIEQSTTKEETA